MRAGSSASCCGRVSCWWSWAWPRVSAGAALLRRLIASQLYGVGAFDPMVLLAVTGVLALVSLIACLGPARRAATVDPSIALGQQ